MSTGRESLTEVPMPVDRDYNPFPPIEMPNFERPSDEELAERRRMFERACQIREAILAEFGPLDVSAGELKHLAREELG